MRGAFYGALAYSQPLAWDTSSVYLMNGMIEAATTYDDQILSGWDVVGVASFNR
jgi:hypothetical protein